MPNYSLSGKLIHVLVREEDQAIVKSWKLKVLNIESIGARMVKLIKQDFEKLKREAREEERINFIKGRKLD